MLTKFFSLLSRLGFHGISAIIVESALLIVLVIELYKFIRFMLGV